ncbi:MAG TPA: rhomboid family intramembrane serine protease [Candidatus Bathyarchaeia archaeon]|nr:rhomboid family intramembrane serine protease [Candidatus Bathyarchaeia archaeon]
MNISIRPVTGVSNMEPIPQPGEPRRLPIYLRSPTIIITITLIAIYLIISTLVGDYAEPIATAESTGSVPVLLLMQCDGPLPIFPWTVLTTIFLHVNVIHIASNLLFLVLFGFILEEQVTKSQWLMTFFITGLVGSLSFVGVDILGSLLTGFPNSLNLDCGVGASGAVYGIMGTAVGLRVVIILIFLLGLDIFAGGGTPAHLGGLVAGLLLRRYWSLGGRGFRGI